MFGKLNVTMVIFLCFVLDKNVFGFDRDVVLLCAYIPPENSTYYDLYDNENGRYFDRCNVISG